MLPKFKNHIIKIKLKSKSNNMEVTGIIKTVFDTLVVSDKFQKREFVLTTEFNTPYPQHVSFQITQDKCPLLDQFEDGEEVKVQFNLRGREWNGPQGIKFFNTLECWRIESAVAGAPIVNKRAAAKTNTEPPLTNDGKPLITPLDEDLPF